MKKGKKRSGVKKKEKKRKKGEKRNPGHPALTLFPPGLPCVYLLPNKAIDHKHGSEIEFSRAATQLQALGRGHMGFNHSPSDAILSIPIADT